MTHSHIKLLTGNTVTDMVMTIIIIIIIIIHFLKVKVTVFH